MLANPESPKDDMLESVSNGMVPENWTPEQETALLLDLCEAQMDAAVRDSDTSVDILVRAFTQLVDSSRAIGALAQQMPADGAGAAHVELQRRCEAISAQVNQAIMAFQFYDKLTQRLGHVRHSLTTLAMFVCDRSRAQQRDHWIKLVTALRRLYRTAEERTVFDLVADGASSEEIREAAMERKPAPESTIEFF